jgi:hypothetical protein
VNIKQAITEAVLNEWYITPLVQKVTVHNEVQSNGGKGKVKPKAPASEVLKREDREKSKAFAERIDGKIAQAHDEFLHHAKARGLVCDSGTYAETHPLLRKKTAGKHLHTKSLATAKTEKGMKKSIRKDELHSFVEIHKPSSK